MVGTTSSDGGGLSLPLHLVTILVYSGLQAYANTGVGSVLFKYFEGLGASADTATFTFSMYIVGGNAVGVVASLAADWWLGSYIIQVWSSAVWLSGSCCLLLSALVGAGRAAHLPLGVLGVVLTAVGAGAQFPPKASFVGDQTKGTTITPARIYSFYYAAENVGAFVGQAVCPLLRVHASFSAAFSTVVVSQVVAIAVFLVGRRHYVRRAPVPLRDTAPEDWAALRRIVVALLPLPVFWALFWQQGSTWVNQASHMNTSIMWHTPDLLVASLESALVCMFVPTFEIYLYPWLKRRGLRIPPLTRMGWGLVACALAFFSTAILQVRMDAVAPKLLTVAWQIPQITLLAVSESMVAVNGLAFAYAECRLGSLVQSVWALMQLGQLLTATLALSSVSAATGFFISASTMMVVALVFAVLSRWFVYAKDPTAAAASLADEEPLLPAHSQQQGVGASSTK